MQEKGVRGNAMGYPGGRHGAGVLLTSILLQAPLIKSIASFFLIHLISILPILWAQESLVCKQLHPA